MKRSGARFLFASIALVLLTALCALAQVFTASVSGLVTDPAQAGISNAHIKIRNTDTNETRETDAGPDGRYIFSQLKPGAYEVTVEAKGFKRLVEPRLTLV